MRKKTRAATWKIQTSVGRRIEGGFSCFSTCFKTLYLGKLVNFLDTLHMFFLIFDIYYKHCCAFELFLKIVTNAFA